MSVSNNVSVRGWRRRTTEEETEEADAEQKNKNPPERCGEYIGKDCRNICGSALQVPPPS